LPLAAWRWLAGRTHRLHLDGWSAAERAEVMRQLRGGQ
jgi:hypothetical protein